MTGTRVIPCLLLKGTGLVKTIQFKEPRYLGDPRNAVRIFNEKEVDELVVLDISATPERRGPDIDFVREIVSEAFMPVAYGGGIRTLEDARRVLAAGVEKVIVGSYAVEQPDFVQQAAAMFGSQSVLVCIDVRKGFFGKHEVCTNNGRNKTGLDPVAFARQMQFMGAGEIIVNSIDKDGTMMGYDLQLLQKVSNAVTVPIVACGGAGSLAHMSEAVDQGGASAVAAGSLFVYHGKHRAVLINYPGVDELKQWGLN
jgi:cyclase